MNMDNIEIRLADIHDMSFDVLKRFNRYQVTNRVIYVKNGSYLYRDEHFVETWDEKKKKEVIESLKKCICNGGIVAGAFNNRDLIGFANIENKFFGENKEYLELPYMHVSYEYRGLGIGRMLFQLCCRESKAMGAKKLYIASHPSVETQNFYKSMGCVPAKEINREVFEREPLDIQLEFIL